MEIQVRSEPVALFSDGGCLSHNPSELGGTWSWVSVDADDQPVDASEGYILPVDIGLPCVSNNVSELVAAVNGLETLPAGWAGVFYTDSLITLRRVTNPRTQKFRGIPLDLERRCLLLRHRLGSFRAVLLGGHPSKEDLKNGVRKKDGKPVSHWNKFCDERCTLLAAEFLKQKAVESGFEQVQRGKEACASDGQMRDVQAAAAHPLDKVFSECDADDR